MWDEEPIDFAQDKLRASSEITEIAQPAVI